MRALVAAVELELELDRVGTEVDEPAGRGVLVERHGAAVHVHDQRGVAVELAQLRLGHAVAARRRRAGRGTPSGPRGRSAHRLGDERRSLGRCRRRPRGHEHRRRPGVGLDVVGRRSRGAGSRPRTGRRATPRRRRGSSSASRAGRSSAARSRFLARWLRRRRSGDAGVSGTRASWRLDEVVPVRGRSCPAVPARVRWRRIDLGQRPPCGERAPALPVCASHSSR